MLEEPPLKVPSVDGDDPRFLQISRDDRTTPPSLVFELVTQSSPGKPKTTVRFLLRVKAELLLEKLRLGEGTVPSIDDSRFGYFKLIVSHRGGLLIKLFSTAGLPGRSEPEDLRLDLRVDAELLLKEIHRWFPDLK